MNNARNASPTAAQPASWSKPVYTPAEVAEITGMSVQKIRALVREGHLARVDRTRHMLIKAQSLRDLFGS